MAIEPVILVIRDPDYENEIEVYGADVRVIDIDLGSEFNGPKDFSGMDPEHQREWIAGVEKAFDGLPAGHPARNRFEDLVVSMKEDY